MKKILLIEHITHYNQLEQYYEFFKKNYDCKVIFANSPNIKVDFKKNSSFLRYSSSHFLFYYYLLFKSFSFNYIYISTPPEYPESLKSIKSLLLYLNLYISFLLFIFFYKNKTIIRIINIHRYFPKINKTAITKLRYLIILLGKRFVLENKYLKNKFIFLLEKYKIKKKLVTYMYLAHNNSKKIYLPSKKINSLGVLGSINDDKKNYILLFSILKSINIKNLNIYFLGRNNKKKMNNFLKKLSNYKIYLSNGYLSLMQFKKWGSRCDYLISLNRKGKKYGLYRGTGSFGDAISLAKPLIAPSFVDPLKEYSHFTIYYSSSAHLSKIFNNIFLYKKDLPIINFKSFSINVHLQRVEKELNI